MSHSQFYLVYMQPLHKTITKEKPKRFSTEDSVWVVIHEGNPRGLNLEGFLNHASVKSGEKERRMKEVVNQQKKMIW